MSDNSDAIFQQFVADMRHNAEIKEKVAMWMVARTESPIEKQFLCSYFARAISPQFLHFLHPEEDEAMTTSLWHQAMIGDDFHKVELYVQRTLKINNSTYRVDFLTIIPSKNVKLVIELDGHNFHERTKEQAQRDKSRDRQLTQAGYKVFRFTGSEVFRDCDKVIDDIYKLFESFGEVAA